MTELEAALGVAQVSKMEYLLDERIKLCSFLAKEINKIDGLKHTKYDFVKHVYYVFGFSYDEKIVGIPRDLFCDALKAEGIPVFAGYVKPLYLNPLYADKKAFAFKHYTGNVKYEKGICPVAEELYEKIVIGTEIVRPPATIEDIQDIVNAIHKIIENKKELLEN